MRGRYDLIIVGAGPAGALLAYHLARAGRGVLLLEKHRLPRPKPCGGGVTPKAARLIPFPWDEVREGSCHRSVLWYRGRVEVAWPTPMCHMVQRDCFDHYMVSRAVQAGARLLEACPVTEFEYDRGGVLVHAPGGPYRGALLVGADGAHSRVAAQLGRRHSRASAAFAAVAEVPRSATAGYWAEDTIAVDFAAVPAGYGWVFPKRRHLNVGVYTTAPRTQDLRRRLHQHLAREGLPPPRVIRAYPVPADCSGEGPVTGERVLLLGDAAGFADPLTGEGIYWALFSATLAADALISHAPASQAAVDAYHRLVTERLRPKLRRLGHLAGLFYRVVDRAVPFLETHPELARDFWEAVYLGDYDRLHVDRILSAVLRNRGR